MRARGKRKRQNDPSRQVYRDLLDKTDKLPQRADVLDRINVVLESGQAVSEDEAKAVASAIMGDKPHPRSITNVSRGSPGPKSPLIKVQSVDDDVPEVLIDTTSSAVRPQFQRKASDPPSPTGEIPGSPLAPVQELPEIPENRTVDQPLQVNLTPPPPT